ncbi:MAG: SurA N-terminal domain-containing protein [Pseudomonadales bacterium]|jgi:peptidyl-prolyl cis-trans isomerase D|nr:SurA N-terminal domain-containing protein [Pseudomonadales bacterium]
MFDFFRQHTKIAMGVLFLLVFPSFVFFGIEGYTRFNDGASKVAVVNGHKISQLDWDNAHQRFIDSQRSRNPNLDLSLFDAPEMKYASLEGLLRERVLAVAAEDQHLSVSDQRLAAQLAQNPAIAALPRAADGKVDKEQYNRLAASFGLTPEGYEASVRAEMSTNQVLGGVMNSELLSPAQAGVFMDAFLERREVRVQRFAPADYAAKLNPSDADLEAFYQAHLARYQAPESARIEYVVLDLGDVKKGITVSEQDLRTYYEQNKDALGAPEERRASHILINAPKSAPAAEREKAKAAATELLAQLRKTPDAFADVARKSSQDDASAANGGDLGFFLRGKGIDPVISDSTYALGKVGDISDVVESDFGYHIIRLTDLKPAAVPPFEQARAKLEDQYRTQQAQKQFGALAEGFTNGVYEQPDSLQPVADKFKLTVHSADNVKRAPAQGATGALANGKFLSALFGTDALERKRNTEALEIGSGQLVSGRVVQYTAAHAQPFAEVRDSVRGDFIKERGAALAREEGQAKLKAWNAQPASATSLPAAITVSRDQQPQTQPPQLLEAMLRADAAKLPLFVGVDLGAEGYAVARVDKVLPKVEPAADIATQGRERYELMWSMAEAGQYYEWLKSRYKASITVPDPAAANAATITLPAAASR